MGNSQEKLGEYVEEYAAVSCFCNAIFIIALTFDILLSPNKTRYPSYDVQLSLEKKTQYRKATLTMDTSKIFISYSHADKKEIEPIKISYAHCKGWLGVLNQPDA